MFINPHIESKFWIFAIKEKNYITISTTNRKVCCLGEILCIVSIFNRPNEIQKKDQLLSKLLFAAFSPVPSSVAWLLFKAYLFQISSSNAASNYARRLEKHHTNAIAIANDIYQNSKCKTPPAKINQLTKSAVSILVLCKHIICGMVLSRIFLRVE